MIHCRIPDLYVSSIEGRIIFHAIKGADVSSVLLPQSTVKIGARLGIVTRVTGSNRIFYTATDGSEKFVSIAGIGYICDTEEEACALEAIRDEIAAQIRSSVAAANDEMQKRINVLVEASSGSV